MLMNNRYKGKIIVYCCMINYIKFLSLLFTNNICIKQKHNGKTHIVNKFPTKSNGSGD